jgi:hypothetical protein
MRFVRIGLWTLAAAVLSAGTALAATQEREGFWIGLGAGYGSAAAKCDDCEANGREKGPAGFLKLGGTLNQKVLLGAEFNIWSDSAEGEALNFYTGTATITFYPWASSGFFVKGGAGVSFVDADLRQGSKLVTVDLGEGFGAVAGVGYDLRIRRNLSLTPVCNFYLGWPGDLRVGLETVARNWRFNVVEISLGLTFH